jgi:hypothetical protein
MALAAVRRACYEHLRNFLQPAVEDNAQACVCYRVGDEDYLYRLSENKLMELIYVRDDILNTDLASVYMWFHSDGTAYKWRLYDSSDDALYWEREGFTTGGNRMKMTRSPIGTIRLAVRIVAVGDRLQLQGYFPVSGNTAATHDFRPDERITVIEARFWFEHNMNDECAIGPFQDIQLVGDDLQAMRGNVVIHQGTDRANPSLA